MTFTIALAIAALAGSAICFAIVLAAQLLQGSTSVVGAMKCLADGNHDPKRDAPTGGFRCTRCGLPGADLSAFNYSGGVKADGYVGSHRRTYDRKDGGTHTREQW